MSDFRGVYPYLGSPVDATGQRARTSSTSFGESSRTRIKRLASAAQTMPSKISVHRHQQRIGSARVEGGRDADDCYRVASEQEAIRREVAYRTGGKIAEARSHTAIAATMSSPYWDRPNISALETRQPGDGAEDAIEALGEMSSLSGEDRRDQPRMRCRALAMPPQMS